MYKNMIMNVLKLIEENHIDMYFNITKEELEKYIEKIFDENKINNDYDFYYYTNMIIKRIFGRFDSHTKLHWIDTYSSLPIRFKYISSKLYIVRTNQENVDLLYGEVKKINNVEIEKIINEIEKITSYSTEGFLISTVERFIPIINRLKSLPVIDETEDIFNFEIIKDEKTINRFLSKSEGNLLDLNKSKDNYYYEMIDDIIYIVYNANREKYQNQMKEFVDKINDISYKYGIKKFIVDIRGNLGGSSEIINPLIDFLKGKEVVTLVDEYVFSGGRINILDLKNVNSKFIGTGIGTTLNCFGNAPSFDFENFEVTVSNKYFYFDTTYKYENYRYADTKEKFEKLKENKELFIPQIFEPDYYVENTIEDYVNGVDKQLEYAIQILNQKTNKLK